MVHNLHILLKIKIYQSNEHFSYFACEKYILYRHNGYEIRNLN